MPRRKVGDPVRAPAVAAHALGPGLGGPVEGEIGQGFSFFVIKN